MTFPLFDLLDDDASIYGEMEDDSLPSLMDPASESDSSDDESLPDIEPAPNLIIDWNTKYEIRSVTIEDETFYDTCEHFENNVTDADTIIANEAPRTKKPATPDYAAVSKKLLFLSTEVVRHTLHATTQFYNTVHLVGSKIRQMRKSHFPAANVKRRREKVATDMIYANTPAMDNGSKVAQLFIGRDSLVASVYPIKGSEWFVRSLWDVIKKWGAPTVLVSDSAKNEISHKVKDVLRYLMIDYWQSEPKHQGQNFCERRYQNIKHNTQNVMNKLNVPGWAWLLCITYVCFVMNRTAVTSLDNRTPIEHLTGDTPDISPILQFQFFEEVYYSDVDAPNTLGSEDEKAGWFVGISESVGHSMTYLIMSKETLKVVHRSSLRRASDGRNIRADERANVALAAAGYATNGLPLGFNSSDVADDNGETDIFDQPSFNLRSSKRDEANARMPDIDPEELVGRTYLKFTDADNGERHRATVLEVFKPDPGDNDYLSHPEVLKLRCKVNTGEESTSYEEIVAYNEIMNLLEKQALEPGTWHFEAIEDHKAVTPKHPEYKGSSYNVLVRWSTGERSWEPISEMAKDDPITVAIYAQKKDLLDTPGWKQFRTYTKNAKKMLRLVNQAKLKSFRSAPMYKYGFQVPRNHAEAMRLDQEHGNTKWHDAECLELDQIDEYDTFDDRGKEAIPPKDYKRIRVHMVYDMKHDGRHKARLVADGHLTEVPLASVYSSVVSLRSIRIVTFLAELNELELWGTDVGNAYLESYTKEKVYIIAGEEFGDRKGHLLVITRALYGLRTSGARWHDRFYDVLRAMGWTPCKSEQDVWMKRVDDHWEYIATYVDDLLIASKNPKAITDELMGRFKFKLKGTGPLTFHLGCDYYRDEYGVLCVSPRKYIERFLESFERIFGEKPNKKYKSPLDPNDHPELDTSEELDMEAIRIYQSLIGGFQWTLSLGRMDMAVSVNTMSSFRAAPRKGHMSRLKRMCGYLASRKSAAIRIRTEMPDYSALPDFEFDWERIYDKPSENIPDDAPEPLGKPVRSSHYVDANLMHCLATGRSVTGVMHMLNKTPIDCFSKKQTTVETATYGSEFNAARITIDHIIDLRTTLRYLGVPIEGKAYMFGDNESVVTSSTIPHSRLNKRHNVLSYHRVREAIAAKYVIFHHINGKINPADILSKHWAHCDVWKMLQAVLFWPGDTAELFDEDVAASHKPN